MKGRNVYYLAALVLLQIASCTTYKMPPAAPMEDHSLLGTYIADDPINKRVEISLFKDGYFHEDGRFKERTIYPASEEMWTEHGSYRFSAPSGYIVLSYDEWPEGDFSGILNANEGILHSPEGNYFRDSPTENTQMSGFTSSI